MADAANARVRAKDVGAIALVVGVAVASYANSLHNGFVWDDPIILSRQLVVFDSARAIVLTPRDIPQYSPDYYRPLTIVSFLLDRAIGGNQPFFFHLSVVIAHAVVSVLVLLLGGIWLDDRAGGDVGAIAAAALFAAHPIHTESVAWIAGRSDVLATCGVLAALVLHVWMQPGWPRALLVGMVALIAMAAKETAICVVPLLFLADLARARLSGLSSGNWRIWWPGYFGVIAATIIYVSLRRIALGDVVGHAATGSPLSWSLFDAVAAIGVYLGKLVWPVNLNAYIDALPADATTFTMTVVAVLALVGSGVWAWVARQAAVTWFIAWLLLSLVPSLAIVWKIPEAPIAERYLYLPSVAFCLLVGWMVSRAWHKRGASIRVGVMVVVVGIITAAMLATVARNRVWHDDLELWSDTVGKSRVAGLPMRSLAVAYQQRGQAVQAKQYFEAALKRRNGATGLQVIHNNLGTIAMQAGNYDEARRHYEAALHAYPNAADTLFNLGLSILQGGGGDRTAADASLDYFAQAERINPHDADIEAALGQIHAIRGERERAVAYLHRALELQPSPAVAANIRSFLATLENGSGRSSSN